MTSEQHMQRLKFAVDEVAVARRLGMFCDEGLLTALDESRVLRWYKDRASIADLRSGEWAPFQVKGLRKGDRDIAKVAVSSDGGRVLLLHRDRASIVDMTTGTSVGFEHGLGSVHAIGITADHVVLAAQGEVLFWTTEKKPKKLPLLKGAVHMCDAAARTSGAIVSVSRHGAIAMIVPDEGEGPGSLGCEVEIWAPPYDEPVRVTLAERGTAWGRHVSWSHDGQTIACALNHESGDRGPTFEPECRPYDVGRPQRFDEVVLVSVGGRVLGRSSTPPGKGRVIKESLREHVYARYHLQPLSANAFVIVDTALDHSGCRDVAVEIWSVGRGEADLREVVTLKAEKKHLDIASSIAIGPTYVVLNRELGFATQRFAAAAAPIAPPAKPTSRAKSPFGAARKVLEPVTLVSKAALKQLADELLPLAAFVERNRAHELCLTVEDGRLVALKLRMDEPNVTGSLGAFERLRSLTLRWGAGPVQSFSADFFAGAPLEGVEVQSGAIGGVPSGLLQLPTMKNLSVWGSVTWPQGKVEGSNLRSLLVNVDPFPHVLELRRLEWLSVCNANLSSVPESIVTLENLTSLNLRGNQLTTLPASVAKMKALREIDLTGNPIVRLPEAITNRKGLDVRRG